MEFRHLSQLEELYGDTDVNDLRTPQTGLEKDARRIRSQNPKPVPGTGFTRPHEWIDVWYQNTGVLSEATHSALVRDVTKIADATRDCFVPSYQNVIDPNLFLSHIGEAAVHRIRETIRIIRSCPVEERFGELAFSASSTLTRDIAHRRTLDLYSARDDLKDAIKDRERAALPPDPELAKRLAAMEIALEAAHERESEIRNSEDETRDATPPDTASEYRWTASTIRVEKLFNSSLHDEKGGFRCVLQSPIHEFDRSAYGGLYAGVEHIFAAAWPLLSTHLRNWVAPVKGDGCDDRGPDVFDPITGLPNPAMEMKQNVRESYFSRCSGVFAKGGTFACAEEDKYEDGWVTKVRTEKSRVSSERYHYTAPHPFKFATPKAPYADFQVVVKAQKVTIAPGGQYKGLWHDEGLHERCIAVIVYYYSVPNGQTMTGGSLQFAVKGQRTLHYWKARTPVIRHAWRVRPKVVVDVKERQLLVFSNYQTVHRVLQIQNNTNQPVTREFVCLFVIDPRHPVPSSAVLAAIRSALSELTPLPPEVQTLVLEYGGAVMSHAERVRLRKSVFAEQMRPRELGAWVLYSTGNNDCMNVSWSTGDWKHNQLFGQRVFKGTTSDSSGGFGSSPEEDSWANGQYDGCSGSDNDRDF